MRISVVGGFGVGMTMQVAHAPRAGETVGDGLLLVGPGGKGSNQAIACARLGADVSLFTAVGPDAAATDAAELWAAEGVDATAIVKTSPTMTGFILVEPSGENRIAIAAGALAELVPRDLEAFLPTIEASDVLLVSLEVPLPVAVSALVAAKRAGVTTVLNPAPATALPVDVWSAVDYLTPNAGEGSMLLGERSDDDPSTVARALHDRLGPTVVMTRGSSPTLVESHNASFTVDALPPRRVRDTTGAGDSFSAAFAVALADGRELAEAVRFANAAGALTVGVDEVVPALPRRHAVEEFLTQHANDEGHR
jgi:ribokinase